MGLYKALDGDDEGSDEDSEWRVIIPPRDWGQLKVRGARRCGWGGCDGCGGCGGIPPFSIQAMPSSLRTHASGIGGGEPGVGGARKANSEKNNSEGKKDRPA